MRCIREKEYPEGHIIPRIQNALNLYGEIAESFDPDGAIAVHGQFFVDACEAVDKVEYTLEALDKLILAYSGLLRQFNEREKELGGLHEWKEHDYIKKARKASQKAKGTA